MHTVIHLSKPIDCTTPRVNHNVNYGIWRIMIVTVGPSVVTNVPFW